MLRKLLKYELRAMGRVLLPIYGAVIVMSVISSVSNIFMFGGDYDFSVLKAVSVLLIVTYILITMAALILSVIISIMRFKKSLLGGEGYLMNTLPATANQHITGKLISACVYQILGAITSVISIFIFVCILNRGIEIEWDYVFRAFGQIFDMLGGELILYIAEGLVFILVSLAATNVMFYAAMSIGHSFNSKKVLKSVCAYIALYFVSQIINSALLSCVMAMNITGFISHNAQMPHLYLISLTVLEALYLAAYYFITNYCLTKRLNLE